MYEVICCCFDKTRWNYTSTLYPVAKLLNPRFAVQTADSVLFDNMTQFTPLTITQTKAELLRYLNLSPSVYTLMAVCRAAPRTRSLTLWLAFYLLTC